MKSNRARGIGSVLMTDAQLQGEAVRCRRQAIADPDIEIDRAELDIGHPVGEVGLLAGRGNRTDRAEGAAVLRARFESDSQRRG
jgi:hypothetical protein